MPAFAFLHGGGQGGWIWDEVIAALRLQAAGVRAEAFDLPGCGAKRGVDTSGLSVRDVAEGFIADLAAADLGPCVLVGHSNAGTILPLVAALRPELVQRYVYVSCIAPAPGQSIRALMSGRHEIGDADMGARLRKMFCNDMDEPDATAFLAKLGRDHWPTAQVLGEAGWCYDHLQGVASSYVVCLQDQALPPAWQEEFATRFGVQRRVYIDAGHQVMNTRPFGLAEILLRDL